MALNEQYLKKRYERISIVVCAKCNLILIKLKRNALANTPIAELPLIRIIVTHIILRFILIFCILTLKLL